MGEVILVLVAVACLVCHMAGRNPLDGSWTDRDGNRVDQSEGYWIDKHGRRRRHSDKSEI